MNLFGNLFRRSKALEVTRDRNGNWFYKMFGGEASYNEYLKTDQKINAYRQNMALNKVIGLIQKVGSLANFNLYQNGKLTSTNYLYQIKPKPNPNQTWTEFIFEFLFWHSIGTAYYYKDNGLNEINRNEYWLNPDKFDNDTIQLFKKIGKKVSFSKNPEYLQEYKNHIIKYRFSDTETQNIPLKNVIPIHSEIGFNNWFQGGSKIESIFKIITNSESSLDAKNINLHFAQKFLVFSKTTNQDHQGLITGFTDNTEKDNLKYKMNSNEKVLVSGAENIELKRFVERFKEMGFDESFLNDYLVIGIAFDVPLDLLDSWLKGKGLTSQGDSMEKSMVRFIEMTIMPILQKFTDVLELAENQNKEVKAEFSHLGFMRIVETEKQNALKTRLENLKLSQELGIDITNEIKNIYV